MTKETKAQVVNPIAPSISPDHPETEYINKRIQTKYFSVRSCKKLSAKSLNLVFMTTFKFQVRNFTFHVQQTLNLNINNRIKHKFKQKIMKQI